MKDVQKVALEKAVRLLDSLKVAYAIVVDDDLSIIKGDIKILEKKKKRTRTQTVPYGTYSTLFKSHGVDDMKIGDVVTIPIGAFDPIVIRKTVSAHCTNHWGKGSSVTSITGNDVEVMRIDNGG
jgi:hypothetical protein